MHRNLFSMYAKMKNKTVTSKTTTTMMMMVKVAVAKVTKNVADNARNFNENWRKNLIMLKLTWAWTNSVSLLRTHDVFSTLPVRLVTYAYYVYAYETNGQIIRHWAKYRAGVVWFWNLGFNSINLSQPISKVPREVDACHRISLENRIGFVF